VAVTDQYAKPLSPRHGHIHSLFIRQKPDIAVRVTADHRYDDDLFFPALKTIDS
jgi:hypothetical protein